MANDLLRTTDRQAYIRGLETGLKWLREMRSYEVESDVPSMDEFIPTVIELVEGDYMERLEKEKAAMLNG